MSNRRLRQLERLGRLRQSGLLTTVEYEAEKRRLADDLGGTRHGGHAGWLIATAAVLLAAITCYLWPGPNSTIRAPGGQAEETRAVANAGKLEGQVAAKVAVPAAPPSRPDLQNILTFADPRRCEFGRPLERLFTAMWHWSDREQKIVGGGPIRVPELNLTARAAFTRLPQNDGTVEFESSLPLPGTWYGLKVLGLSSGGLEESDLVNWQIRFDEAPALVRSVLNEHGFDLPRPGKYRSVADGERTSAVISLKQGAAFNCAPNL
ncbi:MAG: hypothetical protein ACJ8EB_03240 [Allosphingosinicella sp.]